MEAPNPSLVDPAGFLSPRPSPIRLPVADGDTVARSGLESLLLADDPDIAITGSAGDGEGVSALGRKVRRDLLLPL